MTAAMFDRTEIADLLVAHGVDVTAQDVGGLTARLAAQTTGAEAAAAQLKATRAEANAGEKTQP